MKLGTITHRSNLYDELPIGAAYLGFGGSIQRTGLNDDDLNLVIRLKHDRWPVQCPRITSDICYIAPWHEIESNLDPAFVVIYVHEDR